MNTGALPSRAGWNQSGGAHFIIMTDLANANGTTVSAYLNTFSNAASNSGGAFTQGSFKLVSAREAFGLPSDTAVGVAAAGVAVGAGKLLKDMGKTVVSSGRTFRKFQAVATGSANFVSSFGVQGGAAPSPANGNTGYADFYLEVGREGSAGAAAAPAPILRYF
jgi:hypothetical protein